jgi:hypothetical protein
MARSRALERDRIGNGDNHHIWAITNSPKFGGVTFFSRITVTIGDVPVPVLGLANMRTAKRAAGRLKDLADLDELG